MGANAQGIVEMATFTEINSQLKTSFSCSVCSTNLVVNYLLFMFFSCACKYNLSFFFSITSGFSGGIVYNVNL